MCDNPMLAADLGIIDGKHRIKFLSRWRYDYSFEDARAKWGDRLLLLPCGKCPSCTKAYSKTWSIRLMLESMYHECSSFVTLTYDDYHNPKRISKRDVQLFMKRLRQYYSDREIRFFAVGEYGSEKNTHRPHYHLILFGVDFSEDREFIFSNKFKQQYYRSSVLEKLWPYGISSFSDVTPDSCAYVARYSMKKKLDISQDDYFLLMSRRPGIGQKYFQDKKSLIYLSDRIYSKDYHGVSVPRYFDKLAENDPKISSIFVDIKESRKKRAGALLYNNMMINQADSIEASNRKQLEKSCRALVRLRRK